MGLAEAVKNCEGADKQKAPGHQQVTQKEDPSDAFDSGIEHPKANQSKTGSPAFVVGNGRHDLGPGLADQLIDGNNFQSFGPYAFDNFWQSEYSLTAISSAVM